LVTVAVHVSETPLVPVVGEQLTVVVVAVWIFSVVALLVELEAWVVSPPYEADIE
jgi:hypothetical protein